MQSSSLSTYIGYITGPRAEQPVGVRVVEPAAGTRQHQRGSLYAVVEVTGDHPDRAAIVDRLLSEVQRVYYSAKGSQSQVMVEAVQQTQQLLREINAHTPHYPMQLGITCAALLGGKLLVAASGPAFALMRVSERVHMFPSEPNLTVGGYGNVPIEVYRQDVQADDAFFLGGGGWLRRVQMRTLAGIIAFTNADNCHDAADELFDQAGQMQVPGLLIVLGAGGNAEPPRGGYSGGGYPSAPGGSGGSGGGSPRPPAPRRPRFGGGLPTAVNTQPPARLPASTPLSPSTLLPSSTTTFTSPAATSPAATSQPLPLEPPTSPEPSTFVPMQPRSSPLTQEDPPAEVASSTPAGERPLTAPSPETHTHRIHNSTLPASEVLTHQFESSESPPDEAAAVADYHAPYPVSPLEAISSGGDLPVEPGEEFEPIFPPTPLEEPVEKAPRQPSWLDQWRAQTSQRLAQARGALGKMLPERGDPEHSTAWQDISEPLPPPKAARPRYNELEAEAAMHSQAKTRRSQSFAVDDDEDTADDALHGASGMAAAAPVLNMPPFAAPAPARGARARLFLLIALVIAILVPVVVFALTIGKGNDERIRAEELTARAEIVLLGAQSALDQGDKVTARERLLEAQDDLRQAIELDGTNEHRAQLIATIEAELQEVMQVMPLYGLTEPLITFPPDARPHHVLVMNEDIFVIDGGRQALLQYRFDPATGTVADQGGQVLLRQGEQVGDVTVGTLVDLAWLPLIPGFEDRPSLLISDRNNNVFRYDQRVEGATVMPLADRAGWGSIGQLQTYNGRIYVADEAQGSILRYDPGTFETLSTSWFSPETQVNLSGLQSLEIDGDIWLLFENGMILRYREREQLPFSPENSIGLAEDPVDMYVTRQESAYIYVVDAGQDRILVYDKTGAYVGQLRAPEDDLLRGLSGLYIDEVGGVMYILTQSGLFSHPVLP